jgi:putative membrane protein
MIPKRLSSILLIILTPSIFSCVQSLSRPISNWGPAMGFGYGGEYIWFFFLVLVIVAVDFLYHVSKSKGFNGTIIETHLDILKRRYAKGEIDKEEFKRRKNELSA